MTTTPPRRRPRSHDGRSKAETAVFAATEELLATNSFTSLTVAQIIEKASLSRANFYHYFASKDDALAGLLNHVLAGTFDLAGPWQAPVGRERAASMDDSLRRTVEMWAAHGPVIAAALGNLHVIPEVDEVWGRVREEFVLAISEQIHYDRARGRAPQGPRADLIATTLLSATERTFYVSTRGLDPRIPTPDVAVEAITQLTRAAIHLLPPARAVEATSAPDSATAIDTAVGDDSEGGGTDTAAAIMRAFVELLATEAPDDVSVAKILKGAGISRATFYFYFASKDDVFLALYQQMGTEIVRVFEQVFSPEHGSLDELQPLIIRWLTLDPAAETVFRSVVHEWPRRPDLRDAYLADIRSMQSVLEEAIRSRDAKRAPGTARQVDVPAEVLAAALIWTIERSVAGALANEQHLLPIDELADFLSRLTVAALS